MAGDGNIPVKIDRYNDAAKEIQRLIQETANSGEGFRAYGSRWSMNNIAHHKDRMHFNGFMNIHLPMAKTDCHEDTAFDASNLFLLECGNTIKEKPNGEVFDQNFLTLLRKFHINGIHNDVIPWVYMDIFAPNLESEAFIAILMSKGEYRGQHGQHYTTHGWNLDIYILNKGEK